MKKYKKLKVVLISVLGFCLGLFLLWLGFINGLYFKDFYELQRTSEIPVCSVFIFNDDGCVERNGIGAKPGTGNGEVIYID
jgi:hypothetical protein